MKYVDGYVLPVKTNELAEYKKMALDAGKIWIKHGALNYVEAVADDLESVKEWGGLPFPKMAKTKPDETVVFAFVIYKSRKHRDEVNAKIMKDPQMDPEKHKDKPMPFDMKKMAYGGFETIVDLEGK